jgi:hypothetical protein
VSVVLDDAGVVESAVADHTHEPFSSVAERAVRRWRFAPATKGGAPVRA